MMGDKRQEIERLGQTSIEVRRGLDAVRAGYLDYESALEAVVIRLVEGSSHLKDKLMEVWRSQAACAIYPAYIIDPEDIRKIALAHQQAPDNQWRHSLPPLSGATVQANRRNIS